MFLQSADFWRSWREPVWDSYSCTFSVSCNIYRNILYRSWKCYMFCNVRKYDPCWWCYNFATWESENIVTCLKRRYGWRLFGLRWNHIMAYVESDFFDMMSKLKKRVLCGRNCERGDSRKKKKRWDNELLENYWRSGNVWQLAWINLERDFAVNPLSMASYNFYFKIECQIFWLAWWSSISALNYTVTKV